MQSGSLASRDMLLLRTFFVSTTLSSCRLVVGMVEVLGGMSAPGGGGVNEVEPTVLLPTRGSPVTATTMLSSTVRTVSSTSWNVGLYDGLPGGQEGGVPCQLVSR